MVNETQVLSYKNNSGATIARYRAVVLDESYASSVEYGSGAGVDGFIGVVVYDEIADGKEGSIQVSGRATADAVTGTAISIGDYVKIGDTAGRVTKADQTTPSATYVIGRAETATTGAAGERVNFNIRPEYRSI